MLPKNRITSLNLAGVMKNKKKNIGKNLNRKNRLLNNTIYLPFHSRLLCSLIPYFL